MKEFFQKHFAPALGAASTLSFKGISDITHSSGQLADTAIQTVSNSPDLFTYFLIGVVGALGGLVIKVAWGLLKRKFPALKNLDK